MRQTIKRILREETEIPLFVRRRFTLEDLERLVNDVKEMIDDGESLDTAIYDGVREFIKGRKFSDINEFGPDNDYWDSYLKYERPLVRYVKSKLNIQESILEEINPTMRRIIRRADPENINKLFRDSLGVMTTRYFQNKHNWHNMDLNRFKKGIVSYVIVDICIKYSDICYGGGDFYNQVFDFIWNNYSDEMEERWNEITSSKFD